VSKKQQVKNTIQLTEICPTLLRQNFVVLARKSNN